MGCWFVLAGDAGDRGELISTDVGRRDGDSSNCDTIDRGGKVEPGRGVAPSGMVMVDRTGAIVMVNVRS